MSACSEKSFCLSCIHWKTISKVHSFPNNILQQVHCKMDHSILPTKKTNCHWKFAFPRLGYEWMLGEGEWAFFWDSDGSFGSLFALCGWWNTHTLIWNNSPLTKYVHWILRLYNVNANESQVKESSQRGAREERGYFQMRFEMRSWADEVKTYRMAIPDGRRAL